MHFPDERAIRSPGLVLLLGACLVGFVTVSLSDIRESVVFEPIAQTAGPVRDGEVRPVDEVPSIDDVRGARGGRTPSRSPGDTGVTTFADNTVVVGHPILPPRFEGLRDELLASPMLHHPPFAAEVDHWVGLWSENFAKWMPSYLERMMSFDAMVDSVVDAKGLPWSLRYLPVIESGYSPTAVSSASAVGMWQFMAPTARDFGIEVSPLVDDRRDPFVSTDAATTYLAELREQFGSWFLALAAYNAGPERINGLLERYLPDVERSDAVYWALREVLPKETADFVPNFLAAAIVASDPVAFGYRVPARRSFEFEPVPVIGSVTFETIARAAGSTRSEIERLNPEFLRGRTPPEREVLLRLPPGTAASFRSYFADEGL